jgi:hypothetical protein
MGKYIGVVEIGRGFHPCWRIGETTFFVIKTWIMLVNNTLGWIILIIIALIPTVGMFWLMYVKFKASEKLFGLGLLPGIITGAIIYSGTTCVIDLNKDGVTINTYMGFSSGEYVASDGQKIAVKKEGGKDVFIVNGTDRTMALETVEYGTSYLGLFNSGPELIEPHTTMETYRAPDYYPQESPPGSVSVSQGSSSATKYWLRYANMDEMHNGGADPD